MANEKKTIFMFKESSQDLRQFRDKFSAFGYEVSVSNALGSLINACMLDAGCVVLCSDSSPGARMTQVIEELRQRAIPHAVLVMEQLPTVERARWFLQNGAFDYISWNIERPALMNLLERAMQWGETEGHRQVVIQHLKGVYRMLDETSQKVLHLLYNGAQSNQAIAAQLDCSLRTVEGRRAKLLEAFDVTSFAELIRAATVLWDEEILPEVCWKKTEKLRF